MQASAATQGRDAGTHASPATEGSLARCAAEVLAFRAPYLIEKLCNLGVAEHPEQAAELFRELKRYLLIADAQGERPLPVFSSRIDEVWHQFILFTSEYHEFCARFAGRYLHHSPREGEPAAAVRALSFEEFAAAYGQCFGELSPLWRDELALAPHTRLAHAAQLGALGVELQGSRAALLRRGGPPALLCRASARAAEALCFIARERQFLVRELPGLAGHEERLALARPLVGARILRVAP